jgi:hypothetical protein
MASRDTVCMLGMHTLHVKVSKPTVPQYKVTLGSKGNTREGVMHYRCGGA